MAVKITVGQVPAMFARRQQKVFGVGRREFPIHVHGKQHLRDGKPLLEAQVYGGNYLRYNKHCLTGANTNTLSRPAIHRSHHPEPRLSALPLRRPAPP